MDAQTSKGLEHMVRDHAVQAGIALAVALGVWHWKGPRQQFDKKLWRVEEIIQALKEQEHILISDHDGILHCVGRHLPGAEGKNTSLKWVTPGAYLAAVVVLAANAVNVCKQLREAE
jgi:hypothetical protein